VKTKNVHQADYMYSVTVLYLLPISVFRQISFIIGDFILLLMPHSWNQGNFVVGQVSTSGSVEEKFHCNRLFAVQFDLFMIFISVVIRILLLLLFIPNMLGQTGSVVTIFTFQSVIKLFIMA
jgi:hypothetical protein